MPGFVNCWFFERVQMVTSLQQFSLVCTTENRPKYQSGTTDTLELVVPDGISFIELQDSQMLLSQNLPDILPLGALHNWIRNSQEHLLLIVTRGQKAWVNGHPCPRVNVLKDNDHVLFEESALSMSVSLICQPRLIPVPESMIGIPCPICRSAFKSSNDVYVCQCGLALHAEIVEEANDDVLNCAFLMNQCVGCGRSIVLPGSIQDPVLAMEVVS